MGSTTSSANVLSHLPQEVGHDLSLGIGGEHRLGEAGASLGVAQVQQRQRAGVTLLGADVRDDLAALNPDVERCKDKKAMLTINSCCLMISCSSSCFCATVR
jgi:hypothetical protein